MQGTLLMTLLLGWPSLALGQDAPSEDSVDMEDPWINSNPEPAPAPPAPAPAAPAPAAPAPAAPAPAERPAPAPRSGADVSPSSTSTTTAAAAAASGPTETALDTDEEADEGRHNRFRLFYLEASAGFSWIKLGLIRENNLVPEIERVDDSGFAVGGGAGFFVSFLTLGVQGEVAMHDRFNFGTVTLDLGIRIPTPHLEPYLRVGIGYAWIFNSSLLPVDVTIRGVVADIGLGFDYMISPLVAIGIGADASLFNVRRAGVSGVPVPTSIDLTEDGDAIGVQISALAQLSLHF